MTCYNPGCETNVNKVNLWLVSNSDYKPLQYKPFYTCNTHLQEDRELSSTINALCLARYRKEDGTKVECDGWILEKQLHTWKKVEPHECKECERTDMLWRLTVKIKNPPPGFHPNFRYEYLCDGHLSRENEHTTIWSDRWYPFEETWNELTI